MLFTAYLVLGINLSVNEIINENNNIHIHFYPNNYHKVLLKAFNSPRVITNIISIVALMPTALIQ